MIVGGVFEMVVGALGASSGVGTIAGGCAFLHGADVAGAGLHQLISGEHQTTLFQDAVYGSATALGMQPEYAAGLTLVADLGASIAPSVYMAQVNSLNMAAINQAQFNVGFSHIQGRWPNGLSGTTGVALGNGGDMIVSHSANNLLHRPMNLFPEDTQAFLRPFIDSSDVPYAGKCAEFGYVGFFSSLDEAKKGLNGMVSVTGYVDRNGKVILKPACDACKPLLSALNMSDGVETVLVNPYFLHHGASLYSPTIVGASANSFQTVVNKELP